MRVKEQAFPVEVGWRERRTVGVDVDGKDSLTVATPPQFHRDADPTVWSPEDLFVGAAASCLAVTIAGAAERDGLALEQLRVHATGVTGERDDGRYGFTRIEQSVLVVVRPGDEERARAIVERAEERCLVRVSLDVEVETAVEVLALGGVAGTRLGNA